MAKLILLTANASNYFSDLDIEKIKKAAEDAELYFIKEYGFDYDVDIVVTPPTGLLKTIPEDGIGGRTYSSRLVAIVLDTSQAEINKDFVFETICHEMAHSLRWEKLPEHATTLFEGMIMEGLAVALEEKALQDNNVTARQHFLQTVLNPSQNEIMEIVSILKDEFESTEYDYKKIFFTGDETLPRWAGYKFGYHLVKSHLDLNKTTISNATTVSYSSFRSF